MTTSQATFRPITLPDEVFENNDMYRYNVLSAFGVDSQVIDSTEPILHILTGQQEPEIGKIYFDLCTRFQGGHSLK